MWACWEPSALMEPAPCFPQASGCSASYQQVTLTAFIRLWESRCCPTRADSAMPPCGAEPGRHPAGTAQCWGSSLVRAKWENIRLTRRLPQRLGRKRGPETPAQVHRGLTRGFQTPHPPTKQHLQLFLHLRGIWGCLFRYTCSPNLSLTHYSKPRSASSPPLQF